MNKFIAATQLSAEEVGIPTTALSQASVASVLNQVYLWAGIIGVIVIIIAGYLYTTSSGDPAKTKRAKDAILYAIVGLIAIVLAFTITQFVIGSAGN